MNENGDNLFVSCSDSVLCSSFYITRQCLGREACAMRGHMASCCQQQVVMDANKKVDPELTSACPLQSQILTLFTIITVQCVLFWSYVYPSDTSKTSTCHGVFLLKH